MLNFNHIKKALAIIIVIIISTTVSAQNRNAVNSLKSIINNKKAKDTTIIKAYLYLAYKYKNIDLDSASSYADLALYKSLKINYKKGIAGAYKRKGIIMTDFCDYKQADSLFSIAISIYKEINDQTGIMNCYIALSAMTCYKEENRLVIDYSLKALKIAEEKKIINKKGLIFNNIGIAYKNMGDYEKAIKYELNALRIFKKNDNKKLTARCNINIGLLFMEIDEFDKASEYLNKALKLFIELKDINGQGICLLNIGWVYSEQKKFDKELENYNNALELFNKSKNLKGISLIYINIGSIYYESGKYDKANESFNKSLEISEQTGDDNMAAECYYKISLLKTKQKKYKLAEEYCLKNIDFFKKNNALDKQRRSLEQLAIIYNYTGKYQKAYNINIKAGKLKDSVFNIEKAKKIAQLEERYLNEKKDKQIQNLEYENNIKIKHHKKILIIYIIGLFFACAAIAIILIQYRKKNSAYKFLVKKNIDMINNENELKFFKEYIIANKRNNTNATTVTENEKEKILGKLEKLFEKEKIFTRHDLTINKLSKKLSTNRYYLSRIINDEFRKNYSDFINEYRVKEAMFMLSDSIKNKVLSIEAIGEDAGFKTRSSFYLAFKKYAGITPSKFKDNINGL